MVNASLNWASIVGIVLAVGGALLYFMRSFKPALARDYDVFFAAVGLLCGGILFFQGWRLDPILQFGQFLLAGTTVFFAYESVRLRGVTTEQARRSSFFDDDEPPAPRPRMGGGRDWGEGVDRFDEPQPLRRRIRSRDDGYDEREEDDFYRPRRPAARAAIPERAASRDERGGSGPRERDGWDRPERGAGPGPGSGAAGRYRAGSSAPASADFGARRQGRDDQRRGSRPSAAPADDLPRSSRRPGPTGPLPERGSAGAAGVPQGAPYPQRPAGERPKATPEAEAEVSDAEFRPVPPSPRPGAAAPRDNSSRFDD
ncbi:MAG: hypothetical protein RLZZ423_646 [Cyanobacteriota bacterium]